MEKKHNNTDNRIPGNGTVSVEETRDITLPRNREFTIVGMGGSAGALEAIEHFLETVPPDSGIAFVLVQHLEPSQESILPALLRQCTELPVHSIEDGMSVQPNHIYVIPPDKELAILNGKLLLMEPTRPVGFRMPIDNFLQSLAKDWGEKAACIIFSGMGSDGELGARFIKESLGLVIVQDPTTAKYDTMPRSTLQTGMVDFVEEPRAIAEKLLEYVNFPNESMRKRGELTDKKSAAALQKVFLMLRNKTGHDFSLYKKNTLLRRLERRMNIHQVADLEGYARFLQENTEEVDILFKELLIGVTKFFRDADAFELLGDKLIPELLRKKGKNDSFRVWVAGCSTGEEAYSIAILIREALGKLKYKHSMKIQLYATDLDAEAIKKARTGVFMDNISNDITEERLERWFIHKDDRYQVVQEIREMVVFAEHNMIKDASFIKLDLLTCRNVMIYLTAELQRKLLPIFHYTLLPGGILFLGPSETVDGHDELFTVIDPKWKLFRRRESNTTVPRIIEFTAQPNYTPALRYSPKLKDKRISNSQPVTLPDLVKRYLLEKYTPAAVMINEQGNILYISGHTGKYLELAPGQPAINLYDMAKDGLTYELRNAVIRSISKKESVVVNGVRIPVSEGYHYINLMVEPLSTTEEGKILTLVVFQDLPVPVKSKRLRGSSKTEEPSEKDQLITDLEKELRHTREHLQQTIEEMETSYEELKSANEELQSTNEELQSSNEEANTAKEEMQALNEELMTVNMEARAKADELIEVNNDMSNLLNSSEMAIIFVSNRLLIKRFTQQATKVINLIQSDVGRPLSHISSNLKYTRLVADVQEVVTTLVGKEEQVETLVGQWYEMKIMPYRTHDNFINGAVISFTEISALKKTEEELEITRTFMQGMMDLMSEAILVLDKSLRIVFVNKQFLELFQMKRGEVISLYIYELGTGHWRIPALRKLLAEVLPSKANFDNYLIEHEFDEIGLKRLRFKGSRFIQPNSSTELILLVIEEVS